MENEVELATEIRNLRRSIFWTRCGTGLLFIFLGAAIFALWSRHLRTLDANELLLRDKAGNIVARLGQDSYSDTCLTLIANHDTSVASLCVDDAGGSALDLHNMTDGARAMLTPGFSTYDGSAEIGPEMMIHAAGNGASDLITIRPIPGHPKITLVGGQQRVVWSSP